MCAGSQRRGWKRASPAGPPRAYPAHSLRLCAPLSLQRKGQLKNRTNKRKMKKEMEFGEDE